MPHWVWVLARIFSSPTLNESTARVEWQCAPDVGLHIGPDPAQR